MIRSGCSVRTDIQIVSIVLIVARIKSWMALK